MCASLLFTFYTILATEKLHSYLCLFSVVKHIARHLNSSGWPPHGGGFAYFKRAKGESSRKKKLFDVFFSDTLSEEDTAVAARGAHPPR